MQKAYAQELQEQIAEQEARKKALKQEKVAEIQREAQHFQFYDPFGRGGAGAPLNMSKGECFFSIVFRNANFVTSSWRGSRP